MVELTGIAHFAIPVSDPKNKHPLLHRDRRLQIVACLAGQEHDFSRRWRRVRAAHQAASTHRQGTRGSDGVHHAFMLAPDDYRAAVDNLRANGVEIFLEEDRQGGVIDGPRAYFRDPDGTALEFINRTAYAGKT